MVPTYYFVENSINFVSFSESIRFSELTINSLNNINIFQCSLYPFKLSFDYLACDCNEDDNFTEFGDVGGDVELECSSGSGLGVSLLTYCPNETDTVFGFFFLYFFVFFCIFLFIFFVFLYFCILYFCISFFQKTTTN